MQDKQYTTFEQKVRGMRISEMIYAMVDSLDNPDLEMDAMSFGHKVGENGKIKTICFGCYATHFICYVGGFNPQNAVFAENRQKSFANLTYHTLTKYRNENETLSRFDNFVDDFEMLIDSLRMGDVDLANTHLEYLGMTFIKSNDNLILPLLSDKYTTEQLDAYRKLADYNKKIGN